MQQQQGDQGMNEKMKRRLEMKILRMEAWLYRNMQDHHTDEYLIKTDELDKMRGRLVSLRRRAKNATSK